VKKFLLILIAVFLSAFSINNEILLIEAKLYPKITMLIQNLSNKKKINIAIVANKQTLNIANKFKKFISDNSKFNIKIVNSISLDYDVYILTYDIDKLTLKNLIKNKKIVFTIYPNKIDKAMFSIYIGPRIYPYINPKLLKEAKIKINPIIFKVGKIYE